MVRNLESICNLSLLVNLAQFILENNNVSSSPQNSMCMALASLLRHPGSQPLISSNYCSAGVLLIRMAAKCQGLMTNYFSNQSCEYIFQQMLK